MLSGWRIFQDLNFWWAGCIKKKSNCKGNCIVCYFPCYVSPSACVCKSKGFFIKHIPSFQWWGAHVSYLQPFNAGYHPRGGSDGDWRVQVCGLTPESSRRTAALWRRTPLCLSLLLISGTLVCSLLNLILFCLVFLLSCVVCPFHGSFALLLQVLPVHLPQTPCTSITPCPVLWCFTGIESRVQSLLLWFRKKQIQMKNTWFTWS